MKTVLYFSRSRILLLMVNSQGWTLQKVFNAAKDGVEELENWFATQSKHSVAVVLDVPQDTVTTHRLPTVTFLNQWHLVRQLTSHFRQIHCLSSTHRRWDTKTGASLRQYSLDAIAESTGWFPVLENFRDKIWAVYSATLLAECFMLPDKSAPEILLCASCGDDKIRHSFFKQKQLVFTRVLDKQGNRDQFLRQLSDTSQYLNNNQGADQHRGDNLASLAFCVTTDFPDPRGSTFSPGHVQYSIIGFSNEPRIKEIADRVCCGSAQNFEFNVTQMRLFDFLADHLMNSKRGNVLSKYRLSWRKHSRQRRGNWYLFRFCQDTFTRGQGARYVRIGVMLVAVFLLSAAAGYAWQLKQLQAEVLTLQQQKEESLPLPPETHVSAKEMRDVVLLYQSFPRRTIYPHRILKSFASRISLSDKIMLHRIEWSAEEPGMSSIDVAPQLRSELFIKEDLLDDSPAILLRMAGHVVMENLSISEAYLVFQQFSHSLSLMPEWELIRAERVPFDTSNASGAVIESGERHSQYGEFTLLLRTRPEFRSRG